MSVAIHGSFYDFLGDRPEGTRLQSIYKKYKHADDSFAFRLNGLLKSDESLDAQTAEEHQLMRQLICARNRSPLRLYRRIPYVQLRGSRDPLLCGDSFVYPAFFSTSHTVGELLKFDGDLVLEIDCPPGTLLALMEGAEDTMEDEFLLGDGTEYRIGLTRKLTGSKAISEYFGYGTSESEFTVCSLTVSCNPRYTSGFPIFEFNCG